MRVIFVASAMLVAAACVSATAIDRTGSEAGLLKRLRALRTRRTDVDARAAARTTMPTATASVDAFGTDWNAQTFDKPVVIPKGSTLFHSSVQRIKLGEYVFGYERFDGFWMTPDLAQSVAGGVNKARGEFGGSRPVVVTAYTTLEPLSLIPLPSCARAGLKAVQNMGLQLTGTLMANPSTAVQPALKTPCEQWAQKAGLHGWRSPWDQDEVMMCSMHQKTHLQVAYEYVCPLAILGANQGSEVAYNGQKRFAAEEKHFPADKFCGPAKPNAPKLKDNLFSYEAKVHWANDLGVADPNAQPQTPASKLSADMWQRVMRKAAAVPISGKFDRMEMARKYMAGLRGALVTPDTLQLLCDKL